MKNILVVAILLLGTIFIISCQKEYHEDMPDTSDSIKFISLEASTYKAEVWDTIYLRANVEGENISYKWQKNSGSLVGKGKEVIYWGCFSCIGKNRITCTAINETGQKSMSVEVEITRKK